MTAKQEETLKRLQERHDSRTATVQNGLVNLVRNWTTMHPSKVTRELRGIIRAVEELDAVEGALAATDSNEVRDNVSNEK